MHENTDATVRVNECVRAPPTFVTFTEALIPLS